MLKPLNYTTNTTCFLYFKTTNTLLVQCRNPKKEINHIQQYNQTSGEEFGPMRASYSHASGLFHQDALSTLIRVLRFVEDERKAGEFGGYLPPCSISCFGCLARRQMTFSLRAMVIFESNQQEAIISL